MLVSVVRFSSQHLSLCIAAEYLNETLTTDPLGTAFFKPDTKLLYSYTNPFIFISMYQPTHIVLNQYLYNSPVEGCTMTRLK